MLPLAPLREAPPALDAAAAGAGDLGTRGLGTRGVGAWGTPGPGSLGARLPAGRLTELSGAGAWGRTSAAVAALVCAQRRGEPVAWIEPADGDLFPPDLAAAGVELEALVVVRAPRAAGAHGLTRAAELLLRSGAFGLVVVDLTAALPRGAGWQGRLAGLAREHGARVVLLTRRPSEEPALGPMISLRVEPRRERRAPGRFVLLHRVLRDKAGLGAPPAVEARRAPAGAA